MDDTVVSIQCSQVLAEVIQENGKLHKYNNHEDGHNLISPCFCQAMQRTVVYFQEHL